MKTNNLSIIWYKQNHKEITKSKLWLLSKVHNTMENGKRVDIEVELYVEGGGCFRKGVVGLNNRVRFLWWMLHLYRKNHDVLYPLRFSDEEEKPVEKNSKPF